MKDLIKMLFIDNPELEEAVKEFYTQSPESLRAKEEFYETAEEIAKLVGYDLYDRFEQRFGVYLACSNDIYYLFGLGLRQEVILALQSEVS